MKYIKAVFQHVTAHKSEAASIAISAPIHFYEQAFLNFTENTPYSPVRNTAIGCLIQFYV